MIAYSGPVTARALASRAWKSAFGAVGAMPFLFVLFLLLQIVLATAVVLVPGLQSWMVRPAPADITVLLTLKHIASRGLVLILGGAVTAPLAVAVHRYILLEQRGVRGPAAVNLFFWMMSLQLFFLMAFSFSLLASSVGFVRGLIDLIIFIGLVNVIFRLSVMFPGIAIEVPARSAEDRIDQSWTAMQGKFWLWLKTLLLTLLPFIVIIVVMAVLARHKQPADAAKAARAAAVVVKQPKPMLLAMAVVGALMQTFIATLLSSMTSWLYAALKQR